MRKFLIVLIVFVSGLQVRADEGMWLPQLLQQLNAAEMRLKGLQIPVDEIYNINKNSLKDAVVLFGGGCTGEIISREGLLLTNHHCGYGQIQEQSSLEHNYLRDGFWAMSRKEELPCAGLTATFIIRIENVTDSIQPLLQGLSEGKRNEKIKELAARLEKSAVAGTHYEAKVRQFYAGNEFYLIVTETFKDVRLVGAPPSSIGKFGGDTDNWMWPRHTGDFSLFRVYANADNKPAEYNESNVPFVPRHAFSISLGGVQPEDFTMVYGFPGRTQQYISSYQLETILATTNPNRIRIRDARLGIMDAAMRSSEALHLKYAAKQSSVSNGWKKWKGESKGLLAAQALEKKRDMEKDFKSWCASQPEKNRRYGTVLIDLQQLYASTLPYLSANDYYSEAALGVELISFASGFKTMVEAALADAPDTAKVNAAARDMKAELPGYFKDYDAATDHKMMEVLISLYNQGVPDSLKPAYFTELRDREQGDLVRITTGVFAKTLFTDEKKLDKMLASFGKTQARSISKDPAYKLADAILTFYRSRIADKFTAFNAELARLNREYMAGLREFQPDRKFYPDANSTLRLAYGQVRGYDARDAVYFNHFTTLDGIMEKYLPGHEEFDVPARLLELHRKKDYGSYAVNGTVPVAFIATNHTTGGNSGSPVLNAKGHLIGTNYDRVWEGTMSDILFNPEICRNVTLDIRYTLFIIDKFAGAGHLLKEMDILQ
jgi:hypothetical protein